MQTPTFVSDLQKTIHGECEITYTVTSDTIYKTMNPDTDCPHRPVRRVDDIRGYDCDRDDDNKAAGFVSTFNSAYAYEKSGNAFKITSMLTIFLLKLQAHHYQTQNWVGRFKLADLYLAISAMKMIMTPTLNFT